jgi:putative heme-binding domain-containing protein
MRRRIALFLFVGLVVALIAFPTIPQAADKPAEVVPHGQDKPPGPAVPAAEAAKKMTVPEGFTVEVVASEPNIVNPVSMTFDERGRIWITESLEYPRRSAGPGKDRIKILESTKGDGNYDKVSIFLDGLNIPSGIAVGYGGVWFANSPDILFVKEQDGKPVGKPEVVVTGFGRDDTHELPNSLTWGPDGYLYGLNGVFNASHVKQDGKQFDFTCALFRIDPRTRKFELFAEGTSNPWGVAWDTEGNAFLSACVIDHLWHLAETGYYHRQGGPYPPFTWVLESIVKHKHQKAAYCGIHYFDSDAYPPEYRDKLYMGNIHGGCINVDRIERDGATYFGKPEKDFLTGNDAWFMPVAQKTGPDGCLYVLDWYDRYHCYQDANRDPAGIDRDRGRLYRIRYKETPRAGLFDLGKESDDDLIKRLGSPNVFYRDLAQRILSERATPSSRAKLEKLVLDEEAPRKARMHGLWALVGGGPLASEFHLKLLANKDSGFRAWGVRAAGNMHKVEPAVRDKVVALAEDTAPDVKLQVAIAARKIEGVEPIALLTEVLANGREDKIIPAIVWQNLHPLLEEKGAEFLQRFEKASPKESAALTSIMPRVIDRILGSKKADPALVAGLFAALSEGKTANADAARLCLGALATKIQTGELAGERLAAVREKFQPTVTKLLGRPTDPLALDAAILAATMKDTTAFETVRKAFGSTTQPEAVRLRALDGLIAGGDSAVLASVSDLLADHKANTPAFRGQVLAELAHMEGPKVAETVLSSYGTMESDLQPKAIELLTQRKAWGKRLLETVAEGKIPPRALSLNQVKKLVSFKDEDLTKQVTKLWGTIRDGRNPEREKVVNEMRDFLRKTPGNPNTGIQVFKNLCAQCHKIHGDGQEVGPDITSNGRSDFDQLLSNVFDPSLVIGAGFEQTTVLTKKGQTVIGLIVENSPQRVVLKQQGGKLETIPKDDVDEITVSQVSLMPEGIEKQLKPQEIADLFAFLCLDKLPSDPTAKRIPGSPNPK